MCNDADDDVQELDYNLSECTDMPSTSVIDNSSIASPSMIHTESNNSEDINTGQIQEKFEAYCWRKRKFENISSQFKGAFFSLDDELLSPTEYF